MKIVKNKGGSYSVRYKTASGKNISKALGTRDMQEAKKLCKDAKYEEIEMAARAGALQREAIAMIVADRKITLNDLINEWKSYKRDLAQSDNTIYSQETLIRAFSEMSGVSLLQDVTKEMVSKYINQPGKAKSGSREQRHSALKSLYNFAIASGYAITNPTKLVAIDKSKLSHKQKERKRRIPFTLAEYNKIITHADYFFLEATALGWWTGMRLSDIARLEWESINFEEKTLTVHTKKRDVRICLPLLNDLVGGGALLGLFSNLDKGKKYVFPLQAEIDKDPKRRATLSVYYGRMLKRLDITGKSFHCLRHSFVSRCSQAGKSLEDIALWVGHSSTETTEIYSHQSSRI